MPSPLNTPTSESLPLSIFDATTDIEDELKIKSRSEQKPSGSGHLEDSQSKDCAQEHHQYGGSIKYRRARLNLNLSPLANLSTTSTTATALTTVTSVNSSDVRLTIPISSTTVLNRKSSLGLNSILSKVFNGDELAHIDTTLELDKQGWFHGYITVAEAERLLRPNKTGAFLVRQCDHCKKRYSLSLKSLRGFMHIRIYQHDPSGQYTLGQSIASEPTQQQSPQFATIPHLIEHYSMNRLPLRGTEHMSLIYPVIVQLL